MMAIAGFGMAAASIMVYGAAYFDLKYRAVPNLFWLPFVVAAGVVVVVGAISASFPELLESVFFAPILAILGIAAWRLNIIAGADAKGIAIFAFLVPFRGSGVIPVSLETIFCLGVLLIAIPLLLGLANFLDGHRGRRMFFEVHDKTKGWIKPRIPFLVFMAMAWTIAVWIDLNRAIA